MSAWRQTGRGGWICCRRRRAAVTEGPNPGWVVFHPQYPHPCQCLEAQMAQRGYEGRRLARHKAGRAKMLVTPLK